MARLEQLRREVERLRLQADPLAVEIFVQVVERSEDRHAAEMGRFLRLRYLDGMSTTNAIETIYGVDRGSPSWEKYSRMAYRLRNRAFEIIADNTQHFL